MSHTRQVPHAAEVFRPLVAGDLDRVVAIDARLAGRSRPDFMARRLDASQRNPGGHLFTGCEADGRLQGFLLARLTAGEFGSDAPTASLDFIGVDPAYQCHGIGQRLLAATDAVLDRRGVRRVESQADWRNHGILRFFDAAGFLLAPVHVLDRTVAVGPADGWQVAADAAPPATEIDYSRRPSPVELARDAVVCRSVTHGDLDALVRIDQRITGANRREWFGRALEEIFLARGLRVSMVAELDGMVAGFVMARVDYGGFGMLEPVAVLDTLGVDPGLSHRHVASALLSQLLANLSSLNVERIRTRVRGDQRELMSFFLATGFRPGQELAFVRERPAPALKPADRQSGA